MIQIKDKSACCGCSACYAICPKQCITLSADKEGFLYPVVNEDMCIDCGLCEKVCPVLHPKKKEAQPDVFAVINTDEKIRLQSSSGGVFTLIAEKVIDKGGVVFGARFNENWEVVHDYTETKEGLSYFRGSKYVQSKIDSSFIQVKTFLDSGREVLFSGTPCQVAGLRNYLRKPYPNLLTVDLVCHGVPSPEVWKKYLRETVYRAYGIKNSKLAINWGNYISDINFRAKDSGWKKYSFKIEYKDKRIEIQPFFENTYMNVFLANLSLRPSCYNCPAKLHNMQGNITIADFWGVDKINPALDDDKGCGLVLINDKKELDLLYNLDCILVHQELDHVVKFNSCILSSVNKPVYRNMLFYFLDRIGVYNAHVLIFNKSVLFRAIRWGIRKFIKN